MHLRHCQDEVRTYSTGTHILKVVKISEMGILYIYHKQCEIMQKIQ